MALQTKAKSTHQEIWQPIYQYTQSQYGSLPPEILPADTDESTYRLYGNRLIAFAFTCVITETAADCDLAKRYLLTYITWPQWDQNNHRDLGLAHMLLGSTLAYDWLYHILTPTEQQAVQENLRSWAQKMYEASITQRRDEWNNWWHSSYLQNHHWTNHSALGIAGLVLLGEDERAQMWIDQASAQIARVQYLLEGIDDGTWHEGLPYQGYGLTMLIPFALNLKRLQGVDRLPDNYLQNYAVWRIYNYLPNKTAFAMPTGNFEWEWSSSYQPQNVLRFIAAEYRNGHSEWIAQRLIAADDRHPTVWSAPWYVFEFLYYEPSILAQPPTTFPQARTFSDLTGVIWRTGWEANDLVFSLKTGAYGGQWGFNTFVAEEYPWLAPCWKTGCQLNIGHDHDDSNSFYLYAKGSWLIPESVGVGKTNTSYHNTLLIDGQGQYHPPENNFNSYPEDFRDSSGRLEDTASTLGFDYLASDVTQRYRQIDGIQDITRHVLFVRPAYFLMVDNIVAASPHHYTWITHAETDITWVEQWLYGSTDTDQGVGIKPLTTQPTTVSFGNDGKPYAHIENISPITNTRFIHFLYPTDTEHWAFKPTVTLLAESSQATAVRVERHDGSNRVDDLLLQYSRPLTETAVGPYLYDGKVAVVSLNQQAMISHIFLYGGQQLRDAANGTLLVSSAAPLQAIEFTFQGDRVLISGTPHTEITVYAPTIHEVLLNGKPYPHTRQDDYIVIPAPTGQSFLPSIRR